MVSNPLTKLKKIGTDDADYIIILAINHFLSLENSNAND